MELIFSLLKTAVSWRLHCQMATQCFTLWIHEVFALNSLERNLYLQGIKYSDFEKKKKS